MVADQQDTHVGVYSRSLGKRISVLIVDDHPLIRDGLRVYFGTSPDIDVVGECEYGEDVADAVASLTPDVVIMDLVLKGSRISGIEAIRAIRKQSPQTKVLALSAFLDEKNVLGAIGAGVAGYVLKNAPQTQILDAVRMVATGQKLYDPEVMRIVELYIGSREYTGEEFEEESADAQAGSLTPREWEVLELVAEGRSNAEIADKLVIDVATVKTHVSRVLRKLDVDDRARAKLWYDLHREER